LRRWPEASERTTKLSLTPPAKVAGPLQVGRATQIYYRQINKCWSWKFMPPGMLCVVQPQYFNCSLRFSI
jgi:hypothetical protein